MAAIISPRKLSPGQGIGGKLVGVIESPVPGVKSPLLEIIVPGYGKALFPATSNISQAFWPTKKKNHNATAEELQREITAKGWLGRYISIMYTGGVPSKIYRDGSGNAKTVHCFQVGVMPLGWAPAVEGRVIDADQAPQAVIDASIHGDTPEDELGA